MTSYIRWFGELSAEDVPLVGGKNASLGELHAQLGALGIRVPEGFAVTADAYRLVLSAAGVEGSLAALFAGMDTTDVADMARCAAAARRLVYEAPLPDELAGQVAAAYRELESATTRGVGVAVRSSATAEDLPTASFAGQHESYLNVRGVPQLLEYTRRCFASLFTDRAVHYRVDQGFGQLDVALSVAVMRMVRSDRASSGVMFTLDPESGHPDVVLVTSAYGLGENVVQGAVDPDEFLVHKPTFDKGHRTVLRRRLGGKALRMVLGGHGGAGREGTVRNEPVDAAEREAWSLTDEEVLTLAGHALTIERHYGHPMDIEWAKDGLDGRLYIVQARPETVVSQRDATRVESYRLTEHGPLLASGRPVGHAVAVGRARLVTDSADLAAFRPGDVLVAGITTPDWEPVMKTAAAIVTDRGGRTCHAAIVARELGIPAVVGTGDGTTRLAAGDTVTVSCADGDVGHVFAGAAAYEVQTAHVAVSERPRTRIMVNLGNPDLALRVAMTPNDGVGLARMEFVITESIRAHPMALLHPERVTAPAERAEIEAMLASAGGDGAAYFVQRLSEGIGTIAAAFHPKPVVVRMSDFKSHEYAALVGGADFERPEANPMLGFRGASRYAHPAYAEGFALECRALARVRGEMGLRNVVVMLPFVRRLEEADRVLAAMAEHGLRRGEDGLEVYAMCELPANVLLLDELAERFDGFSIGSNDLTQLTLGVDRDSELVSFDYDERDEAVRRLLRMAVEGCRRHGVHSGLCGQAPSDFPEMAAYLVGLGIDSLSLNPDSVLATTAVVLAEERRLAGS